MNYRHSFLLVFLSLSLFAKSQTADEIVNKYIQFTGGAENWKSIKTLITSGNYNYGGVEFPFTSYAKAPNLYKYEVPFNGKSFMQAYNGEIGWRIDGFKNETSKTILKDKAATKMANESDIEIEPVFINYKTKGYTLSLLGKDSAASHLCYKIKMEKAGDTATYFFDTKDYSLIQKLAPSRNYEMDNAPMEIVYSNYVVTDKIKLPRKIVYTSLYTRVLTITVNSVKLNEPIENGIFQP